MAGGGASCGGGDGTPGDGAGSPVDITGLPQTVVVTVVVVSVIGGYDVAGMMAGVAGRSSSVAIGPAEGPLRADDGVAAGLSSAGRGGVWQATVLLGGPPPVHPCDVGVVLPLCVAAAGVGGVVVAPSLARRRCDASPTGGCVGGVRCRAPLFSTGAQAALEDLLVDTPAALVCGGVGGLRRVAASPRSPPGLLGMAPVATVDGGGGEARTGLAAGPRWTDALAAGLPPLSGPPRHIVTSGELDDVEVWRRGPRVGPARSGTPAGGTPWPGGDVLSAAAAGLLLEVAVVGGGALLGAAPLAVVTAA